MAKGSGVKVGGRQLGLSSAHIVQDPESQGLFTLRWRSLPVMTSRGILNLIG